MTTPYTPKIGDILTGVDARGVRGPARYEGLCPDHGLQFSFQFVHRTGLGLVWDVGELWHFDPETGENGTGLRVLFEPWQEPAAEAAPKLTTIGDIAGWAKPGTVVAVHLVVREVDPTDGGLPLALKDADGGVLWPRRDTPCTIISEPEPEPWKAGDRALLLGEVPGEIVHIHRDHAWFLADQAEVGALHPLSNLERPQ